MVRLYSPSLAIFGSVLDLFPLSGCPIDHPFNNEKLTANTSDASAPRPTAHLLQDINLIDEISHITHERIPERVVHAKGAGAYGQFKCTSDDIQKYTDANFLSMKDKTTKLLVRFSTVFGERGFADTVRDTRGFAFKLYTEEGNLDWLFFHPAVFPIRDPAMFPSLVHATKRNPSSNLHDPDMFWDFFNNNIPGYNMLVRFFTDRGTPFSYEDVKIASVNTYTYTKASLFKDDEYHFVRINLEPEQTKSGMTLEMATEMAGRDSDFHTRTLYDNITNGIYPTWKVWAYIIGPSDVDKVGMNIFDATKVLPEPDGKNGVTKIEIGEITLNGNPENSFTEIEQAAFNPANLVPGWDLSPDPILQIRSFAYGDTQRYRLGVNHDQLPPNAPKGDVVWNPERRDGAGSQFNYGSTPNYVGKRTKIVTPARRQRPYLDWDLTKARVERSLSAEDPADWKQPADFWNKDLLTDPEYQYSDMDPEKEKAADEYGITYSQYILVFNIANHLSAASDDVRMATYMIFSKIDPKLGDTVMQETQKVLKSRKTLRFGSHPDQTNSTLPAVAPSLAIQGNVFRKM
ncbi:catalase-like domain-containing protein [Aspergillus cavernicola]|uniref:Catalase-like domain-containing protein n=1 Tax=Aspergillus cavernicola TaxID=176166 RepID=A0ABR4IBF8_9EURO